MSFHVYTLSYPNLFENLAKACSFEGIGVGRQCAVVVDVKDGRSPLVRTTSKYTKPAQKFASIHHDLVAKIQQAAELKCNFNNALVEIYDVRYKTMKEHSDQALDLEAKSFIALLSCYNELQPTQTRTLRIKDKITKETAKIVLHPNSLVVFDTITNAKFWHQIVLEKAALENTKLEKAVLGKAGGKTQWLGITFRLSKAFVGFVDKIPLLYPMGKQLRIASEEEAREFYKHRHKENTQVDFVYPELDYTVSPSDLLPL